jgi:hypothetical protein
MKNDVAGNVKLPAVHFWQDNSAKENKRGGSRKLAALLFDRQFAQMNRQLTQVFRDVQFVER